MGCGVRTVDRYAVNFRAHGLAGLQDRRINNRGSRKTTPAQDQAMVARMRQNSFQNSGQIHADLDLRVSQRTIRRRLNQGGLTNHVAAKKIFLTDNHRLERINFARECLPMTVEDWRSVIFTDEKVFSTDKDSRRTVWREKGQRYHPNIIKPQCRSGRITASFWGWVSAAGPGEIVLIERTLTAVDYINILEDVLVPSVRALYPADEVPIIRTVEDNSSVHRAGIVRAWYAEHPEVQRFNWPAKSPDLNIIENVWSELGQGWKPIQRERKEGLCRRVFAAWEELRTRPEYTETLVESMPRRMRSVLDSQGHPINY